MFKSRSANKRVEIYSSVINADGYGGNVATLSLLSTRWCTIEDVGASQFQNEAGITDFANTLKFTFRYDKDLIIDANDHVLRYNNKDYSILSVKTQGFKHVQQIITAKQILGLE